MNNKICSISKEKYSVITHRTGVKIIICEKNEYASTYAIFASKYGSNNTLCKIIDNNNTIRIPDGTAHFLEHKLFENENEDAFTLYAKTGADANAYTTFDKTAYLFSCTDNFEESFEILLNFVQAPYFTDKSVAKEQGIIAQEIKMYEDNPSSRVFWDLMKNLFVNHSVAIDTAGTVESIAEITPKLLYDCYNTFYNPENMVIVVCGNITAKKVLELCDKLLLPKSSKSIEIEVFDEPEKVKCNRSETELAVDIPLFAVGYKDNTGLIGQDAVKAAAETEILLELLAGKSSELYNELYKSGDINSGFEFEYMYGNGFGASIFTGVSNNPDKIYEKILFYANKLKSEGIDVQRFNRAKKLIFGRNIRNLNSVDYTANIMLDLAIMDVDFEKYMQIYNGVTLEDCVLRLNNHFKDTASAISIIKPYTKGE